MHFQNTFNVGRKTLIPLYAEHLHFLIKSAGLVSNTFDQSKFKKDFVVMNQKSRQQQATTSV